MIARELACAFWMRKSGSRLCLSLLAAVVVGQTTLAQQELGSEAILLEQRGDYAGAEAVWRRVAAGRRHDATPLAHIGLLEAKQLHYEAAVPYYRRALEIRPDLSEVALDLGLAYFKIGANQKAITVLKHLLAKDPDNLRLNILIGMAEYGLGNYAAAVPYLRAAQKSNPDNLPLLLDIGHSCLLSHEMKCVLDVYNRMSELNLNSAQMHMLKGEALDEMKDTMAAIQEFQAAVNTGPSEPNAHFGLGYLLWTQKSYPEAKAEFEAELRNDPGHSQACLYLGDTDVQLGRMDDGRKLLETFVQSNSSSVMALTDLAIIDSETGDPQGAIKELRKAIRNDPRSVNAHWRLARIYRSLGKKGDAEAEFEKAKNLNQEDIDALALVMERGRAEHSREGKTIDERLQSK